MDFDQFIFLHFLLFLDLKKSDILDVFLSSDRFSISICGNF